MRRRYCVDKVRDKLGVSERPAARQAIAQQSLKGGMSRTQATTHDAATNPKGREDEERLVADMIVLAHQYGRYSYRRVAALQRSAGM